MVEQVIRFIQDISRYGLEKAGLYYSQYRGYVVDNEDPAGYGRLLVTVPEIYGDYVLKHWAYPSSTFSGKGYGVQCIPRKNDLVWVTFEKGNARRPLWKHGYFGKGDKPENLKDIKNYWFKTPAGHLIEFNDTAGTIKITRQGGKILEVGETEIGLGNGLSSSEVAALGNKTKEKLESLIDILTQGPLVDTNTGALLPDKLTNLTTLKVELGQILSQVIKIQ
jgi:hypothetical protein